MSENSKCPCCGDSISIFPDSGFWECDNCPFMCALTDFPRISAAMEAKARHNALEARTKQANVWHECDKCCCLFIPGGKGSETTCATCIKEELNELVEAVRKLRKLELGIPAPGMNGAHKIVTAIARAEVDRLIANESTADCEEDG